MHLVINKVTFWSSIIVFANREEIPFKQSGLLPFMTVDWRKNSHGALTRWPGTRIEDKVQKTILFHISKKITHRDATK